MDSEPEELGGIEHFEADLRRLILRYRHEYDMNYAEVIGALTLKSHELCAEAYDQGEDGDEE